MNSLTKSPVPAQTKLRMESIAVRLMKWLQKESSRSVRRSESSLNNGMLEQRRAILSIILSFIYLKFDGAYKV